MLGAGSTPIEQSEPVVKARDDICLVWNSILEQSGHMPMRSSSAEVLPYPSSQDLLYPAADPTGQLHGGSQGPFSLGQFPGALPVMLRGADGKVSSGLLQALHVEFYHCGNEVELQNQMHLVQTDTRAMMMMMLMTMMMQSIGTPALEDILHLCGFYKIRVPSLPPPLKHCYMIPLVRAGV